MTELLAALIILIVGVIGIGTCTAIGRRCEREQQEDEPAGSITAPQSDEREREVYYMRNFWSYDGSDQKEWNE